MFKTKKDKLEKEFMKEEDEELEEMTSNINKERDIKDNRNIKEDTTPESVEGELNRSDIGLKETRGKVKNREDEQRAQIENLKDKLLRKAAEFENYKKRNEAEAASFYKYANENLITSLLPVLDDFDRVLISWNEKHDVETLKKGVELIYEKFKGILEKQGLKEIDSTGKEFDVNLQDALLQAADDKSKPNTVLETVEKGYFLKDKVIRHAKVIVSAAPVKEQKE
jgi:molecular chaperone GrpE